MNLNSPPPSHFPMHHQIITHENDHRELYHHLQDRASSLSCHFFFGPTPQDQTAFYDHRQLYQTNLVPDENYNCGGGSTYDEMKNKVDSGVVESSSPMKWMSSKMRVMQKMKNNHDDEKQPSSSDLSSNSSSYNAASPIRVCSDCSTTKTPLWRSGPKGPKSLCNACGIRQRKARRAMAAAAAAATSTDQFSPTKIKQQNKAKLGKNGHASQIKKRCRAATAAAAPPPSNGQKHPGFEDFLINLSKNLAFHRVFPDDVKDAAILLMALSSGLVNG